MCFCAFLALTAPVRKFNLSVLVVLARGLPGNSSKPALRSRNFCTCWVTLSESDRVTTQTAASTTSAAETSWWSLRELSNIF
uniref:Putative secreted protein n=1 Tax=Ixodes ricinus TaxID=34613 RepID=A0A6B0U2L4_IXORI